MASFLCECVGGVEANTGKQNSLDSRTADVASLLCECIDGANSCKQNCTNNTPSLYCVNTLV